MFVDEKQGKNYKDSMEDLDQLKSRSSADSPVLVVSYQSWMYLYLQRPIATYTTWYDAYLDTDALSDYYRQNPEKTPKYIYIVYTDDIDIFEIHIDNVQSCIDAIDLLFDYTTEELTNGLLLTVTDYHGS